VIVRGISAEFYSGAQPPPPPHPHPSNPPSPSLTDYASSAKSPPQHRSFIRQDRPLQMADSSGATALRGHHLARSVQPPTLTYLVWAVPRHPEVQTKLQAELKPCSADPLGKGLRSPPLTQTRHRRDLPPLHSHLARPPAHCPRQRHQQPVRLPPPPWYYRQHKLTPSTAIRPSTWTHCASTQTAGPTPLTQ
jgi:hypothetical protein